MRKAPAPPAAPPGRRHPVSVHGKVRRAPSPALVARWRRELIRLRGADACDRPDYIAHLARSGLWMDGVDFTTATDAQVISRMIDGEAPSLPPDAPELVEARASILAGAARLRARMTAQEG